MEPALEIEELPAKTSYKAFSKSFLEGNIFYKKNSTYPDCVFICVYDGSYIEDTACFEGCGEIAGDNHGSKTIFHIPTFYFKEEIREDIEEDLKNYVQFLKEEFKLPLTYEGKGEFRNDGYTIVNNGQQVVKRALGSESSLVNSVKNEFFLVSMDQDKLSGHSHRLLCSTLIRYFYSNVYHEVCFHMMEMVSQGISPEKAMVYAHWFRNQEIYQGYYGIIFVPGGETGVEFDFTEFEGCNTKRYYIPGYKKGMEDLLHAFKAKDKVNKFFVCPMAYRKDKYDAIIDAVREVNYQKIDEVYSQLERINVPVIFHG